ncbi:MAG: hypothetical protein WC309_02065 [Candidatus Paceibacterota bacterium]|jgi:phenylacetate-CoA ligase
MFQKIIENLYFGLYKILKNSNTKRYYQYLKYSQWDSLEKNKERQKEKLYNLLRYALSEIPYYQQLRQEKNIKISRNTVFSDIKTFPILTKEIIRERKDDLYNKNSKKFFENTSGGSTGEPVIFFQDKKMRDWGRAAKIIFDEWASRKIGERKISLWGSEKDIFFHRKNFKNIFIGLFLKEKLLNSFKMGPNEMTEYIRIINSFKPNLVLSYVSSMEELIKFITNNNFKITPPRAVMTSAGVLSDDIRNDIHKVFNCPVFNRYGSRETSAISCDCEKHDGLHVIPDILYFEIVDEDGKEVKPGENGYILITLLTNFTMPLIRYKIGDRATSSIENCPCRRGWPIIKNIVGRTVNVFTTSEGEKIDGEYFTRLFYFIDGVKRFQIIQKDYNLIEINIVSEKEALTPEILKDITDKIKLVMGKFCSINFNFLDKIEPSPSGKYLYTISEIHED